ncbi:hypothetical protein MIR68_005081 [Amoeboaphelidium protococcarum]|nr:hypothetical protein MIR68_005081 [Amoeboaphelidium protococcarum]
MQLLFILIFVISVNCIPTFNGRQNSDVEAVQVGRLSSEIDVTRPISPYVENEITDRLDSVTLNGNDILVRDTLDQEEFRALSVRNGRKSGDIDASLTSAQSHKQSKSKKSKKSLRNNRARQQQTEDLDSILPSEEQLIIERDRVEELQVKFNNELLKMDELQDTIKSMIQEMSQIDWDHLNRVEKFLKEASKTDGFPEACSQLGNMAKGVYPDMSKMARYLQGPVQEVLSAKFHDYTKPQQQKLLKLKAVVKQLARKLDNSLERARKKAFDYYAEETLIVMKHNAAISMKMQEIFKELELYIHDQDRREWRPDEELLANADAIKPMLDDLLYLRSQQVYRDTYHVSLPEDLVKKATAVVESIVVANQLVVDLAEKLQQIESS